MLKGGGAIYLGGSGMKGDIKRNLLQEVHSAGDHEELVRLYDTWAAEYESDLLRFGGDKTPSVVTALATRYIDPQGGAVLDAGVGTGRIGEMLSILGFRDIAGIDVSDGMLAEATKKGVYKHLRKMALGDQLDFPDNHFVGTVCSGVLTIGHAPPDSLDELTRVTCAGGYMVFSISTPGYLNGGFGEKLESLDALGRWRRVLVTDEYVGLSRAGDEAVATRVYVYQVL
jgi:ubiquinone/menaquinone biosynthesis C-methylase UbiE